MNEFVSTYREGDLGMLTIIIVVVVVVVIVVIQMEGVELLVTIPPGVPPVIFNPDSVHPCVVEEVYKQLP